ncbi:MAG: T9SS type A sorting domain-containing protein [Bacteroidetes bacterium]|nr:T9SS type A sorting domain-containing protein [Bacteroidota bacterium]
MRILIIILVLLTSIGFGAKAQLSFPNGNVLNLNTHLDYLYFETEVLFHTGNYIVDDYRWEKISDSVDNRWLVHACFNGDCWISLPDSSNFVGEYGINDTTAFIRFHVWSYQFDGGLTIKYRVINNKDSLDQAVLTFNIHYSYAIGINDKSPFREYDEMYPNPVRAELYFNSANISEFKSLRIIDIGGKTVFESSYVAEYLDISQLPKGFYIISVGTSDQLINRKIFKN